MVKKRVTKVSREPDTVLATEDPTGSEVRIVKKTSTVVIIAVLVLVLVLVAALGWWFYKPKTVKTALGDAEQAVTNVYDKVKHAVTPGDQPTK
jgi:flagellar basal body-associated protein FliL